MRKGRRMGHIITIDLLSDARRHGVGRMLLLAVEEHFKANTARSIQLEVAVDNLNAQMFYQAMGYARIGMIPGYYGGHLDALVMQKLLMVNV
jgi:ribosomal protein S18 acetylase RimI-like enzyme